MNEFLIKVSTFCSLQSTMITVYEKKDGHHVISAFDYKFSFIECQGMAVTCPATLFDVINSMLCIARVKAQRLKYLCLSFTIDKAKIQRAWKRAISDPSYALCRKRLLREFNDITPCPDTTS